MVFRVVYKYNEYFLSTNNPFRPIKIEKNIGRFWPIDSSRVNVLKR